MPLHDPAYPQPTSFLFEKTFGVVDLDQPAVRALGGWDNSVTVTTPEDIGALTADIVFARQPKFKNEVVYTAGDTVSTGALPISLKESWVPRWLGKCGVFLG
jgi:hypothetical protein